MVSNHTVDLDHGRVQGFCERFRKSKETGENNFLILQAEDELAAIGHGDRAFLECARAFTSTAGPGIS